MNTSDFRPDDRQTLSALFDGELEGDARMFALRRLGHDAAWQQACGQWQLVGDVMRRQAPIAAPAGFAERVAASVAAEPPGLEAAPAAVARPAPVSDARRSRNRWIGGGALAASLALAVVMTTRAPEQGAVPGASPVMASQEAVPATAREAPGPVPSSIASSPSIPSTLAPVAAPRAIAAAPRANRVASVPSRPPTATADARRAAAARTTAPDEAAITGTALLADGPVDPFNLGRDTVLTGRPWPRAMIPAATGTFTARYGTRGESAGERPTFYPFEPRPQGDAQAPAPPSP